MHLLALEYKYYYDYLFARVPKKGDLLSEIKNPSVIDMTDVPSDEELNQLIDGTLCPEHPHMFQEIYHGLLFGDNGGMPDPYFVLKDLPMYMAAQMQISRDYTDKDLWLRKAVMNTACSGVFAADRTIKEYNDKIWHLKPLNL